MRTELVVSAQLCGLLEHVARRLYDASVCAPVMCRCDAGSMVYVVRLSFNSVQHVNKKIDYDELRGVLDPGPPGRFQCQPRC